MNKSIIRQGDCFCAVRCSFAIAETKSGYRLYMSVSEKNAIRGQRQWSELPAGQDAPEGWFPCSDPIPAGVPATVYDAVPGALFHLKGCSDGEVSITNL